MIKQLRLGKGLSQEELAQMAGISVRTLQRVEAGETPALETARALASVLEVSFETIQGADSTLIDHTQKDAIKYVKRVRGFYSHLIQFTLVMAILLIINVITSPHFYWVVFPFLGWGVGVLAHATCAFEWFPTKNSAWERKQIERYLNRH